MKILKALNNTAKRVIVGILIGTIGLSCLCLGGIHLFCLLLLFIIASSLELIKILKNKGFYPYPSIVFAINILFLTIFSFGKLELYPFAVSIGVIGSFLAVLFNGSQPYIANISSTIFCFMYCSLPCYLLLIREVNLEYIGFNTLPLNAGFYFILMLFFNVLFTDVGAYYIGTKYGKHKLAPIVSPKKSIEGALGGALLAIISSLIIGAVIKLPIYHSIALGVLITVFAQLGDLCESLIKRDAGVKDSGNALAGHGGFLDRADSYTFAIPVVYFYLIFFILENPIITNFTAAIKGLLHVVGN